MVAEMGRAVRMAQFLPMDDVVAYLLRIAHLSQDENARLSLVGVSKVPLLLVNYCSD